MGTGTETKLPTVVLLCSISYDTYCLAVMSDHESYHWFLDSPSGMLPAREATEDNPEEYDYRLKTFFMKGTHYPITLLPTCLL